MAVTPGGGTSSRPRIPDRTREAADASDRALIRRTRTDGSAGPSRPSSGPASVSAPDTRPARRPTPQSQRTALASTRFSAGFQAFRLNERLDETRRAEERARTTEARDRQYQDFARLHRGAETALAGVPPDVRPLAFETEREDGGAAALEESWRRSLYDSLGPGDRAAVDRALEDNSEQLDILSAATFGTEQQPEGDRLASQPGAEHLYEPLIASLAEQNPGASFELVAADQSVRAGANPGSVPLIAMTTPAEEPGGAPSTRFYEVRPENALGVAGAPELEQAVIDSGRTEEWYEAFRARPEYSALDRGSAEETIFQLQSQNPGPVFDVIGDLPPAAQADIMNSYAQRAGDQTFGGLLQETQPPASVLVAVGADHLATGGAAPQVIRSTTDIGGVSDNGKEAAVLEQHRDALYAPIFGQYALRGERPPLEGASLINELGAAFGIPPNNLPDSAAANAAFENGTLPLYRDEALALLQPIADQIEATGGTPIRVETIPLMVESDVTGRPPARPIPLFRIEDRNGEVRFIDDNGLRYDSVEDWRENNRLPAGTVTHPAGLSLNPVDPARPAELATVTEPTHAVVDSPGEYALAALDVAALAGGVALGGAAIVASGGALSPAVGAAITWGGAAVTGYTAARAGLGLYDLASHGGSLDPRSSDEARSLWLDGAAGALGFAALGSAGAAQAFTRAGSSGLAQGFARTAAGLGIVAETADAAAIGSLAHTLATDWENLPASQRAQLALQIGFWGSAGAATARTYSGGSTRRAIDQAASALPATAPSTAPAGLGDLTNYRSTPEDAAGVLSVPGALQTEAAAEALQARPELSHIPLQDLQALLLYTGSPGVVGSHFRIVNRALRGDDPAALGEAAPLIRATASALNQLPAYQGRVYRVTDLPPDVASSLVPGATYSDPGFLSTSTNNPLDRGRGGDPFVFVIDATTHGHDISGLSGFPGEAEVLFTPGTPFVVQSRSIDPRTGQTVIHLAEQ